MRIVGWLASALGVIGIYAGNAVVPVVWILKLNVQGRIHHLLAIPEGGLERAITLTDTVAGRIGDTSGLVGDIKVKADRLAEAPDIDQAAATDLATAISDFVTGPYADMRSVYAMLRERATTVADALEGLSSSIPFLALPSVAVDRLQAIDARLVEFDTAITSLAAAGAAGLSQPGVAARVSERAGNVLEVLATVGEHVTDAGARMKESRERVTEADHRIARRLTAGAAAVTIGSLYVSGLNVLLFKQGRRWSRR